MEPDFPFDRLPAASMDPGSFADVLRRSRPEALPGSGPAAAGPTGGSGVVQEAPHGTTILALRYDGGVVIAGDRRATEGYSIAHRSIEKVFPADRHSTVSNAGAAGPALEMVKLFQTNLEHYEKVEGVALSLEGKANQLGGMIRDNLAMAMQ